MDINILVTLAGWAFGLLMIGCVLSCIRLLPNHRVGIRERVIGHSIKSGSIMALNGEAGYEPLVMRGGLHFLWPPYCFRVHSLPLVTIPQGKIGYVFARDGHPLGPDQTLASNVEASDFQDVVKFLQAGGQRGPQRQILREGTYVINLAQFVVITEDQVYCLPLSRDEMVTFQGMAAKIAERGGFTPLIITDDLVGIVTVHDGPSLPQGELIAPVVGDDPKSPSTHHNTFQDADKFLAAGGFRGRQLQVLVEGTYFINRLFATVDMVPKTIVDVGNVCVVVSYTGETGQDVSGADYSHGELVKDGQRGVWDTALLPGKYAINTFARKGVIVPTTNFILKWNRSESGVHKFDENLAEVSLITKDAFEPLLPLAVVVHIDYRKAPLVIQRFGDIKRLVDQTLDPMVAAYFKNIAQSRTLIQLIQDRSDIQNRALTEMHDKFEEYNLELQEVLIGTPTSHPNDRKIDDILMQLRSRQIAAEQVETFNQQEKAAAKERELREAEARAKQQGSLTESELSITIQSNQGKADYQRSLQAAAQMRAMAEAEAARVRALGEAEADRVKMMANADAEKAARVGIAQAMAIEEQVRAYGGPRFQLTQSVMNRLAEAVEKSGVDVVPRMLIGGSHSNGDGGGSSGSIFESLLALLLSEKAIGENLLREVRPPNAEAARLREEMRGRIETAPEVVKQ